MYLNTPLSSPQLTTSPSNLSTVCCSIIFMNVIEFCNWKNMKFLSKLFKWIFCRDIKILLRAYSLMTSNKNGIVEKKSSRQNIKLLVRFRKWNREGDSMKKNHVTSLINVHLERFPWLARTKNRKISISTQFCFIKITFDLFFFLISCV